MPERLKLFITTGATGSVNNTESSQPHGVESV